MDKCAEILSCAPAKMDRGSGIHREGFKRLSGAASESEDKAHEVREEV